MWLCDTFTKLPKDRICLFHVELFRSHTHPFGPCWLGSHLQSPAGVRSLPSGGPWCEASLNAWLDLSKTPTPSLSTISACISRFIHPAFLLLSSPGCYRETALAFAAARPLGQNQATWISIPPLLAFPAALRVAAPLSLVSHRLDRVRKRATDGKRCAPVPEDESRW